MLPIHETPCRDSIRNAAAAGFGPFTYRCRQTCVHGCRKFCLFGVQEEVPSVWNTLYEFVNKLNRRAANLSTNKYRERWIQNEYFVMIILAHFCIRTMRPYATREILVISLAIILGIYSGKHFLSIQYYHLKREHTSIIYSCTSFTW